MTLSIVASVEYADAPTMKLVASSSTSNPNAVPNNSLVDVWRVHEDGTRHRVLTEQAPRLIGGGWAWLDLHCPYNQLVSYEITANGNTVSSGPAWLGSDTTWLLHPARADLAVMVEKVRNIGDRTTPSRRRKFTPIGGKAFSLSDGARDGVSGSVSFRVSDEAPYRELFEDDTPILINTPGVDGWDVKWMWVQPEDVSYRNPADGWVKYPYRHVVMPYEETADPDMDFEPAWTSEDAYQYWTVQLGLTSGGTVSKYASSLAGVTDTRV